MNLPPQVASVAFVANGAVDDYALIAGRIRRYPFVVAVDAGLHHCYAMGVTPHLIVGDMDSVTPALLASYTNVPIQRLQPEKDQTDLEVAIETVVRPHVVSMVIFAALNRRTDQSLGNLHLLRRYPGRLLIESETEMMQCVRGEVEFTCSPGQTLSLIPLGGPVRKVSSRGLKWELKDAAFDVNFMSISNQTVGERLHLSVPEGDLLCIVQTSRGNP